MTCRINRNPEDGSIQSITAENGNNSELFPKLLELTQGDNRAALELYALSQTEEFKEISDLQKMLAKQNLEKFYEAKIKPEDVSFGTAFDFQTSTAEQTTGRDKDNWGNSQVWRERIENAGDILRELSSRGERPDSGYLLEKVNKLKNWIKSNKKYPAESIPDDIKTIEAFNKTNLRFTNTVDSYEYLKKFHYNILKKVKKEYEAIPTYTKEQRLAVDLVLDLINNNLDGLESKLNDIENIANKIKKEGKLEIIPDVKLGQTGQIETVEETVDFVNEGTDYFATVGGRIVGRLRTYDYNGGVKVDSISVVPEYQGMGIGGNLCRLAIKDAAKASKAFYSDDYETPDAKRILESLRREGIMQKIDNKYVVNPFGPSFDKNGEPSDPKTVVSYAQNTAVKTLSEQEKLDVQNAIMAFGHKDSQQTYQELHNALHKNGLFIFTEQSMKDSGLWNDFEISSILSSSQLQDTIRQTVQKLSNTEPFEVEYNEEFVFPKTTELNSLGKQAVENPFVKEKEIVEAVSNKKGQELLEALDTMTANKYGQNESFRYTIKGIQRDKKVAPVQTIKDGELVDLTQDITPILPIVLDTVQNQKLSEDLELISRFISEDTWQESLPQVAKVLKSVRKNAKKNGIDLRDLPSRAYTHTRGQILSLLDSMENLLEAPSQESLENFANNYNEVLDFNQPMSEIINSRSVHDKVVFTTLSEYELFEKHNLVRSTGRTYRQVQEQPLQELYEAFYENRDRLPSGVSSLEDLQKYVQKNLDKLNLPEFSMDTDILEKLFLYKTFFKFPLDSGQDAVVNTANLPALDIDTDYLSFDFVKDFNHWILATDNQYFTVTEAGIQLTASDPISKQEAVASVPKELREYLAQYDQISKSLNLGILEPTQLKQGQIDSQALRRLNVINNPQTTPKLSGEYTYLKDGVLAAKNQTDTFVRTPQGVYEMIYQQGNVNFYNKLPESNPYYKVTNASKPLSDIDFSKYQYLETSPEIWKTAKNYYSQAELKQIEKEHFACQI